VDEKLAKRPWSSMYCMAGYGDCVFFVNVTRLCSPTAMGMSRLRQASEPFCLHASERLNPTGIAGLL
jgi:hypothetical protein